MKRYKTALFFFRRDLRLEDNLGLNATLMQSERVIACFALDPRQIEKHPYQSQPALGFMTKALQDLQSQLHAQGGTLYLFKGLPQDLITQMNQQHGVDAVFVNRDYTPFSRQRDNEIQQHCAALNIDFHASADALLNEPEDMPKAYQVFTAFYNRAQQIPVALPAPLAKGQFMALPSSEVAPTTAYNGGRSAALKILHDITHCEHYTDERDYPSLSSTSDLSPYLKFGCCSVREAYHAVFTQLGSDHPLIRQFYWRDFFTHIAWNYPHVFSHAFHRRYDAIQWRNDKAEFQAWADGRTGFPIVDAGMRELNETGLMHNRVRMIVASFLTKDLHISWRWGERYFAQHLLDYDPSVNNGNWQWASSTGCDAQPYFRIFNPWLQQKRFDPECLYIKRWVPELRDIPPALIHNHFKKPILGTYPPPMVDHAVRSQQAKMLFQELSPMERSGL